MENYSKTKTKSHKGLIFNVKKSFFVVFALIICLGCVRIPKKESSSQSIEIIKTYMQEQEDCWNKGELECFMKHYWKSDSLRFIGKSGLNNGWQKTLDNYKKSYKNKEEMGTLKFDNKSIDILGEGSIFVIGEWELSRTDELGNLKGMYSLIWQQKKGKWVITTDHSS